MLATMLYLIITEYVGYTIYKYVTWEEENTATSCFDEGAEEVLLTIRSDAYDYH